MKITSEQLATFGAGLQGLMASQKVTYTVDGKRVNAKELEKVLDVGIKRAFGAATGSTGGLVGGEIGGKGVNRFMYKVKRNSRWF